MKRALGSVLLAVSLLAAGTARASDLLTPDPTGLWFDPSQPGWGLEVAQQGETAFAILFTYDANHKPVWYVASHLDSGGVDWEMPAVMRGTLYRTTGPAFSATSFSPRAVTATPVGTMQLAYPGFGEPQPAPGAPRQLNLTYSIDGVQFTKKLTAQTWSTSAQDLVGDYAGQFFLRISGAGGGTPPPPACPSADVVATPPVQPIQPYVFSVAAGETPDRAVIRWGSGVDIGCSVDAAYARDGQLASLSGSLACGPIGSPAAGGIPVRITDIAWTPAGFFGAADLELTLPGGTLCSYYGGFGGVLRAPVARSGMNPDPTGVWFIPLESGWGLILTQQGPNIFAALFAYDADGKPTWWAASNVVDTGKPVDLLVGEAFAGPLYSTTGPYFGNTGDSTPFSATQAGTLRIAYVGGTDSLALSYTVGATTVEKTLQRETWSRNSRGFSGNFTGGLFPTPSACGSDGLFAAQPTTLSIVPGLGTIGDPNPASARITWTTANGTACVFNAAYTQTGQLGNFSGPVQCASVQGSLTISSIGGGFAGFANFTSGDCTTGGFVGGAGH